MLGLAVITETFAVIARDHDRDRAGNQLLEPLHEAPELLVHRRDLAQVGGLRVAAAEGLGWVVGSVRVEVVDPHEERRTPLLGELRERPGCGLGC